MSLCLKKLARFCGASPWQAPSITPATATTKHGAYNKMKYKLGQMRRLPDCQQKTKPRDADCCNQLQTTDTACPIYHMRFICMVTRGSMGCLLRLMMMMRIATIRAWPQHAHVDVEQSEVHDPCMIQRT
jgi:hypothetical protein